MTSNGFDIASIKQRIAQHRQQLKNSFQNLEIRSNSINSIPEVSINNMNSEKEEVSVQEPTKQAIEGYKSILFSPIIPRIKLELNNIAVQPFYEETTKETRVLLNSETVTTLQSENEKSYEQNLGSYMSEKTSFPIEEMSLKKEGFNRRSHTPSTAKRIRGKNNISQISHRVGTRYSSAQKVQRKNEKSAIEDSNQFMNTYQTSDSKSKKKLMYEESIDYEKQTLKNEKISELQAQLKKLEDLIALSERKEEELKQEKNKEAELEKAKIKELTAEIERMKQHIDNLRNEADELFKKLEEEESIRREKINQMKQRKLLLLKGLQKTEVEYSKNKEIIAANTIKTQEEVEELRKKVDILSRKEEEKRAEIIQKKKLLDNLRDNESQVLSQLDQFDMQGLSEEVQSYVSKLNVLQKERTELVLELENQRKLYPLELSLVEKQEDYELVMNKLTKEKEQFINQRKNIQIRIDELRNEIKEKEEENEQLKKEFQNYRRQEEEKIYFEEKKFESVKRHYDMNCQELNHLEGEYASHKKDHQEFVKNNKLQTELIKNELSLLRMELKRLEEERNTKQKIYQQELLIIINEFQKEYSEFFDKEFGIFLSSRFEVPLETISILNEIQQVKGNQTIGMEENFDKSLFELYKEYIPQYNQSFEDLGSVYLGKNAVIEIELEKKIDSLHRKLYEDLKQRILWLEDQYSRSINDTELKIGYLKDDILESVLPVIKEKFVEVEKSANVIVSQRHKLLVIMQLIEQNDWNKKFQIMLLENWEKVLEERREELEEKIKAAEKERDAVSIKMEKKIGHARQKVEESHLVVQTSEPSSYREELRKRIDAERQRISSFSQYISQCEEEVNSLNEKKKRAEQGWDSIIQKEKEFVTKTQEEMQELQSQLATKFKYLSSTEVAETGGRLALFTKMIRKLQRICSFIEDLSIQAESNGTAEIVEQIISTQNTVEEKTMEIHSQCLQTEAELQSLNSDLIVISKERKRLDDILQDIIIAERKSESLQELELSSRFEKKKELTDKINEIERKINLQWSELDNATLPLNRRIEYSKNEIAKLLDNLKKRKKDLEEVKNQSETVEAGYLSEISTLRGQRQLLKHRIDIKLKAIENIKEGDISVVSNLERKSLHSDKSIEQITGQKSQDEENSYFKMHIKKKETLQRKPFNQYDSIIF